MESSNTPGSSAAAAAKHYLSRGWSPIRLHGVNDAGTCTCMDREKPGHESNAGKHPTDKDWASTGGLDTPEAIDESFAGWRAGHNVGIRTGAPSGFFVLDVDPDNGGRDSFNQLLQDHGRVPMTRMQKTGSGGFHLLFQMPADFEPTNRKGGLKEYRGLDIRGTGGQIVAAPSRSAKGPYEWANDYDIAPAPEWLLELLRPAAPVERPVTAPVVIPAASDAETQRLEGYCATVRDSEVGRLKAMQEGAAFQPYMGEPWNQTTFDVACALLELANSTWTIYGQDDAESDLFTHAPKDEGFGRLDHEKCWRSALARVEGKGRPYPEARPDTRAEVDSWLNEPGVRVDPLVYKLRGITPPPGVVVAHVPDELPGTPARTWDDLGNAMRFVDHFGSKVRWVNEEQSWALFDEGRWALAAPNVIQGLVQEMFDERIMETEGPNYSEIPDDLEKPEDTPRAAFAKWLKSQRMSARIAAAQKEAQGRPELQASKLDFDATPFLLNCTNGVVDLRNGQLLAHDPSLMLMSQCKVDYDPLATAPAFERFLEQVHPEPEMRDYLHRILGYTITGDTREQAIFIHHGDGANGKSVFTDLVGYVLGDYGFTVAQSTLMSGDREEHPAGVAALAGRRWLHATETAPGKRLDEEKVKNLTGDATVTARFMGGNWFEFTPTGKIHLITNHLPRLSNARSIWRRIHLIKWGVTIPAAQQDRTLQQRLKETEIQGILTWLVRGTQAWLAQGLNPPASALRELAQYRDDEDVFGEFLRERCLVTEEARCTAEGLYSNYQTWAWGQGIRKPMTQSAFCNTLVERGFKRFRDARSRGFTGIMPVSAPVMEGAA